MNKFIEVYTEELTKAVQIYPQEYMFPIEHVPVVVQRVANAIKSNMYNKDGIAFKNTCKRLNIKYTYKAINDYVKGN